MGSTSSKTSSIDNITVDLYSSDATNQLLKNHLTNQRLSDILQPLATISTVTSSSISSSSVTMTTTNNNTQQQDEKLYYTSLVNNINKDIMTRVYVAQRKMYGFGTKKNMTEGFRELYYLRNFKESYYPLACYYYDVESNYPQAYAWFEKCQSDHFAKYRMALMLFHGQVPTDLKKAFDYMTCSATEGNPYAQFILGVYYQHGIVVKQADLQLAKMWYERSANQGFAEAQTATSNLLINQIGIMNDKKMLSEENKNILNQALDWLYKAESQENASALIRLGSLHEEGILVQQDYSKAIKYYERATKSPFASTSVLSLAHYLVGIKYRVGDLGLEQDYNKAFTHLTKSTEIGYAPAQRALGLMYAEGIGTLKDPNKARTLFESAASQGDVRSLGLIADSSNYQGGLKSAMELYEKAAKAGNLASQISLAQLLLRTGQHTAAFKWFEIASKSTPIDDRRRSLSILLHRRHNNKKERISILDFSIGFLSQRNTARLMVARYRYNGWGGIKQDRLWAFQEFRALSIKENFSDAHYWLAACYEEGVVADNNMTVIIKPDLDLAFDLYTKAAIAGDIDSQFEVAYMLSNGYTNKKGELVKDMEAAFAWYIKAAERGHKTAQYSVGLYYENGLCTPVDIKVAIQWYELAAKGDMTLAMVRLARLLVASCHDDEKTVISSATNSSQVVEAFHWLKKAIENGEVSALRELAIFYKNGLIVDEEKDNVSQQKRYIIAFELFQQAADKDDAMSWHALSKFYEGRYGEDVVEEVDDLVISVNFEKAVSCLKKAEDLGYSVAGLDLADLYYRNNMIEETLQVYTRITNTNDLQSTIGWKARLEMAKIAVFGNGGGAKLDQLKVYQWLVNMATTKETTNDEEASRLMNRGYAEIFELLGYCLEKGIGTPINKEEATRWYKACISDKQDGTSCWWPKKRSLCRLITTFMEEKDYTSAFTYLEKIKPNLEEMSQLSVVDASLQARRMKYYLGYLLMYGLGTEKKVVQESISWLSEAADQGEGDAAYELGRFLAFTGHDVQEIRKRYEQGVVLDHAGCMRALALLLLAEENDQEDVYDGGAEILRLLEHAAELQDTEAIYQLGLSHKNGLGTVISKDIEKALEYYVKAATQNHEVAMIKAGEILGNLLGRHPEAIHWFQKAVDLTGNIKAKVMLVSYDFQGLTSPFTKQHDDTHNFEVLQSIIDQEIATMKKGTTTLLNQHEKEERLSTSRTGLGLAFYILGQCYELGRGTSISLSMAKEWYHRSVLISQHVDAMWRLGVIYSTLKGNDVSALEWYRNAAEKGRHRESHYQLGLFHLKGLGGLEENYIAAQKYFSKASDQGHPLATFELARVVWNQNCDHFYGYELFKLAGQLHVPGALRELGHLSHTGFSFHGIHIVNQDYKRAFAYYCEAAQMGDPTAALMVGNYFEEGYLEKELGQDCERALQWYESAYRLNGGGLAELAIGKLKHMMADTIADSKEAEDMREEAFVWFESAANEPIDSVQGTCAKVMVALYHLNGWGRKPRDTKTGFNMLLDIAESGGSEAFVSVARCYEEGIGTEHDMMKAMDYWELAADMDDQGALIRIGEIYELGLWGPVDKETANNYYNRAEIIGSRHSKRNSGYSIESMSSSSSASLYKP